MNKRSKFTVIPALKLFLSLCLIPVFSGAPAQTTQNIKGVVRDGASGEALIYANVLLVGTNPPVGVSTDSAGNFVLNRIPVGRYDIQISCLGYEQTIVKEILLMSSKEVFLEISLKEDVNILTEIVISPRINKTQALNPMIITGGRMLSVEESSRYAGGFDDPARLVSSFAGVTGSIGNNGIVVRGNAPKFLQWRMEDVEIPNPNHFAEVASFGGGGMTALSNQVLGNSDFLTGAFPAEYSNAVSGVFDISLRNGNTQNHEHTVQAGIVGIDLASEGPFRRGGSSSYIFNYRYSTLSLLSPLLPDDAGGMRYQDLSFKLNFPTETAGAFSLWGTGLIDRSGAKAETDRNLWNYLQDRQEMDVKQFMSAAGISHKISAGENAFIKTSLAATVSGLDFYTEQMNDEAILLPENVIQNTKWNFVLSTLYNKKFSARHTNRTGIRMTGLQYSMLIKNTGDETFLQTLTDESGFSSLMTVYTSSVFRFSDSWTMNAGLNSQWFTLNNRYSVEPRLSVKWQFHNSHSFGLAYGFHSRLEMLNYYFTRDAAGEQINKNLDFTRSRHLIFSYDWNIGTAFLLKIEPYVQQLYNVPVIPGSNFSFINLEGGSDWFIRDKLLNTGKGFNCGVDFTFEKYMSQGYYFLLTGSIFDARYKNGDKWHNSRYNRNFACNFLAGKEWIFGKNRQNIFGINGRLTCQGGNRYSPVNETASVLNRDVVYDETNPYSLQLPAAFIGHLTVSYKINKKNRFHEFAFKMLNLTGYKDFFGHRYNFKTGKVEEEREAIVIPNVSYKIEF